MTLVRLERFAEALPVLEHAARLEPAAADVQLDLGRACLNLGRHRQALAALETFLRLRPGEPEREQVERVIDELRAEMGDRD
jgi:Flp pilus assembly protein TadD